MERRNAEASRTATSAGLGALDEGAGRLVNGEYGAMFDGDDALCMMLKPVAMALQGETSDQIEALVGLWLEQIESLRAVARMICKMRELEQHNQVMATASDEMALLDQ